MNTNKTPDEIGREEIAKMARADGEHTFAREVLAGCWDHRNDVSRAIQRARDKEKANQKMKREGR